MLANPEVYVLDPNRNVPSTTWNPLEVIENFVSKIPEMNVKFGDSTDEQGGHVTVKLKTSLAATLQDSDQITIEMGVDMDNVAKLIGDELKNYGFKAAINRRYIDVSPGMYKSAGPDANGQRLVMYTVEGGYCLEVA
jgi:hypothetical protein|tara:strand:+ start:232 stop:642 length:411 start_codon:yes stop_codon:yes gene_type:complete